jgi:hypothetical protein
MKKLFVFVLAVATAFSCSKELGGEITPINVPSSTTLSGNITVTTTLTADKEWTLKGYVYVADGATLIIQPGTVIKSDISEKGALCIERGAKIQAEGTAAKPIIFTSGRPAGERSPGDWGGIVILGRAKTNRTSEPTIEGGIGRAYGGSDNEDNSGVMKYVRIEYAGIAALPNSEINALTFGGVGSKTIIENVQTIYANDDAFEFFGGTVSPKYLYAYATADDDYDFDFGYTGKVSFSISRRDPQFVDTGDAGNGIECDNDGTGSMAIPITRPVLDNMTLIGPNDAAALSNHNLAMRWRRATQFEVTNSTFIGYMKGGFSLESNETAQAYKDGASVFKNNKIGTFTANNASNFISRATTIISSADVKTKALKEGNTEIESSNAEILKLEKPSWTTGWTRFPTKGN